MSSDTFELALAAALRDKAEEIAMSTDLNEGRARLERSLDEVDAGRRKRMWVTGALAAAAVAVVIAIAFGVSRPSAEPPATGPSTPASQSAGPSMTVSTSTLTPNLTADLPYWTAFVSPGSWVNGLIWYSEGAEGCQQGCADDKDRTFMMVQPRTIALPGQARTSGSAPSAQQVVEAWTAVQQTGYGTVVDAPKATTVGGEPATSLTVQVDKAVAGPVGCENDLLESCIRVPAGRVVRVTVVDTGDPLPTVFYLVRNASNPASGAVAADLDAVVGTVTWG